MKDKRKIGNNWYAVRTFYCKEASVAQYFSSKGVTHFIPQRYQEEMTPDGERKRILVPAVHNLVFIKPESFNEKEIKDIITECPVSISVIRNKDTGNYYPIPNEQMVEFRAICDPDFKHTLFVEQAEAEARIGEMVNVIRGQFKGLRGKLVRYKNRSYVVIILAGIGVMVHIPKWYCRKIVQKET